ncbi:MAG: hypothetical protein EON48_11870, partial [Acetobacteraceae bacterium]
MVLTLALPPVNELTPDLRSALMKALAAPGAKGVVLSAEGPNFSAHLPLEPDLAEPSLAELCQAVSDCAV